jgi:hypothetical protein
VELIPSTYYGFQEPMAQLHCGENVTMNSNYTLTVCRRRATGLYCLGAFLGTSSTIKVTHKTTLYSV